MAVLLAALALLAGIGGSPQRTAPSTPRVSLTVTYWADETKPADFERWTVTCLPRGGIVADAARRVQAARLADRRGVRATADRHALQHDLRRAAEGGRQGHDRRRPRLVVVPATEWLRDRPLEPLLTVADPGGRERRSLIHRGRSGDRPPAARTTLIAMPIGYTTDLSDLRPEQLTGFFEGWPRPPAPERHLATLRGSYRTVIALDEEAGTVVGFVNAISDGVLSAFVPLLEVLPSYRGRGIGTELVRRLLEELEGLYSIDVVCDEELRPFYERFGMEPLLAMAVRNR